MPTNHLIIGLGGTGGRVIRAFRKTIFEEYRNTEPKRPEDGEPRANLKYLYVDSNKGDLENTAEWKVLGHSVRLNPDSLLLISDANVRTVLENAANNPGIAPWLGDREVLEPMLANAQGAQGAQQIRRFGRFLFASRIQHFVGQVQNHVAGLEQGGQAGVTFHVACTLAAGTGSGSFIDAIVQIRRLYGDAALYPIFLYVLVTDRPVPANTGNFYPNQFAALAELNALKLGLWKPHDVTAVNANGDNRPQVMDVYQQCFIISAVNEVNDTASREEQEKLIADYLYQRAVALGGNAQGDLPDSLRKALTFEDVAQYPHENNARSYFFGSIGIKRLILPEVEIKEKLAYSFAEQACRQLRFNNWTDQGYSDEAQNRDIPELVAATANDQRWYLTSDHLKLSTDFRLSGGKSWPRFHEDWKNQIGAERVAIMEDHAKDKTKWIAKLDAFAAKYFDEAFRNCGVVKYYEDKEKAVKDYAAEIRQKIEKDLFQRWAAGEDSASDTLRILDALADHLKQREGKINKEIANEQKKEQAAVERQKSSGAQWKKIGLISDMLGKSTKVFESYADATSDYYIARTEAIAWRFATKLVGQIKENITELRQHVSTISDLFKDGAEQFRIDVASRIAQEEEVDYAAKVVRLLEPENVNKTIKRLVTDRNTQELQTASVRQRLCHKMGEEPSFGKFAKSIHKADFIDTLTEMCDEQSRRFHDEFFHNLQDDYAPIYGKNIVQKLHDMHGGTITEELRDNLTRLIQSAVPYLQFDENQSQPGVVCGDVAMPKSPLGSMVVFLPTAPDQVDFREELKELLEAAVPPGVVRHFKVADTDHNPHEITIISSRYWFALRFVRALGTLPREHYNRRMAAGADECRKAVHQVHLENHMCPVDQVESPRGYGSLPDLFLLDDATMRRQALPTILLAQAMGLIYRDQDDAGHESLYFARRNEAGRALDIPVKLGATDLVELRSRVTPQVMQKINGEVSTRLHDEWRSKDRRDELAVKLDTQLDEIYRQRNSRDNDPIYQEFFRATREAKGR